MGIHIRWDIIAPLISALCSFITLVIYYNSLKKADKERTERTRAIFYIIRETKDLITSNKKVFEFEIKNRGYTDIRNIKVRWNGDSFVKVSIIDNYWGEEGKICDYKIVLNCTDKNTIGDINGSIILEYNNIYGEVQKCYYNLNIISSIDKDDKNIEYLDHDLLNSERVFIYK